MTQKQWAEYRYLSTRAREVFKAMRKAGMAPGAAFKVAVSS